MGNQDPEKLEQYRKARQTKKSLLTRKTNELRRLVAEDSRSLVIEKYDAIKAVFSDFVKAHDSYHSLLTEESDLTVSDAYYDDVEIKYIEGLNGVSNYIKSESKVQLTKSEKTNASAFVDLSWVTKWASDMSGNI